MATQYLITTNGVELETLYTSKARAIAEGEKISTAAQERGKGDVITVQTVKTHKVVWTYTAPESNVTIAGDEPTTWAPDFTAHGASECYFGCGVRPVAVFVDYVGVTNGVCAADRSQVDSKTYDIPVSDAVALVRAVQDGAMPVAGVIQAGRGMMGTTHYHAAACADVKREMGKWGQSEDDVIRGPFLTVAEIIEFEFSDVEDGNWNDMMSHATDAIRIMPCLSSLPAGRTPNGPLVIHGNVFCEGFDRTPDLNTGPRTYGPIIICTCGTSIHDNDNARKEHEDNWHSEKYPAEYMSAMEEADGPMTGQYDDYNYAADGGGFTETVVTKEYHLYVCVDDISGAMVDLGWHTLTLNAAQVHDLNAIADAYAKMHGSGKPRHGWASVIGVVEICDI